MEAGRITDFDKFVNIDLYIYTHIKNTCVNMFFKILPLTSSLEMQIPKNENVRPKCKEQ